MSQLKFPYKLVALGILCAASTVTAHATSIVFETSFDHEPTTYPTPAGSTIGSPATLSVTGGDVFYVGGVANDPGNPCFQAGSSSATCLELPTYRGITPMLTSTFVFDPGFYTLEIVMAGGTVDARVLAEIGAPNMILVPANSRFTTYQASFTVPKGAQSHLTITGNNMFLIDSVRVALLTGEEASPVPEPGTWSMMLAAGLGLVGVGIYRRRG